MARHRWQIWADILNVAKAPVRKTWILYRANLSFEEGTKHIANLLRSGLLVKNSPTYETTGKGRKFLELYTQITQTINT